MLIIKRDGIVYLVESVYDYTSYGEMKLGRDVENAPVFKVPGSKAIAGVRWGNASSLADVIRYEKVHFPKQLSAGNINNMIIPRFIDAFERSHMVFSRRVSASIIVAKDDKAFLRTSQGAIMEIEEYYALGNEEELDFNLLELHKGKELMDYIHTIFEAKERYTSHFLYPLICIDTKSCKPRLIERRSNE